MNRIKEIRERLKLTQTEFGDVIGCSQGNVGHYERGGQVMLPDRVDKLIAFAAGRGLALTMGMVYGREPLPPLAEVANDETHPDPARKQAV